MARDRSTHSRIFIVGLLVIGYLSFAVIMGIKDGLHEGFLPALLMPVPIVLIILAIGNIPLWAGNYGDVAVAAVWFAEITCVASVAFLRSKRTSKDPGQLLLLPWLGMMLINFVLQVFFVGAGFD